MPNLERKEANVATANTASKFNLSRGFDSRRGVGMRRPSQHLLGGRAEGPLATTPGNVMVVPLGRAGRPSSPSRSVVQP